MGRMQWRGSSPTSRAAMVCSSSSNLVLSRYATPGQEGAGNSTAWPLYGSSLLLMNGLLVSATTGSTGKPMDLGSLKAGAQARSELPNVDGDTLSEGQNLVFRVHAGCIGILPAELPVDLCQTRVHQLHCLMEAAEPLYL